MTTTTTTTTIALSEAQKGPAEKLLDLVLASSAHLWHNRPGVDVGGTWHAKRGLKKELLARGTNVRPGLHVPAAQRLYVRLLDIFRLNAELAARFASYALAQTEWRDLKVACAALMLVQPHAGQPVKDDDGTVGFHDDDFRLVGEAMVLFYEKKSTKMLTPKSVLRIAELLETPQIAELNKIAGFAEAGSRKAPLGRWKRAASRWLAGREKNLPMLQGLVKAGYKETIKNIARKCGYKPETQAFFEVLGWKQKQSSGGHREVGLSNLKLQKRDRFDNVSEAEICEAIVTQKLSYKDVVGRLPKDVGLTPAIMVACLPSLSDRDLRIMTPTLEDLGLMAEPEIRKRWEKAIAESTDQRSLNIAKNVRSKEIKEKLVEASDNAAKKAVKEATAEQPIDVMFLIDKSGSMDGAIDKSKEALSRILAGFPEDRVHIASFDTVGTVLKPKAPTRAAVQHMLASIKAGGGTVHAAGIRAIYQTGFRLASTSRLIVIVVGDECGEDGPQLAKAFNEFGYAVSAIAMIVSVNGTRGRSIQDCARALGVPFSEVQVDQFEDAYQVPRVLRTLLEAPTLGPTVAAQIGWLERVIATPLCSSLLDVDYTKFLGKTEHVVLAYLGGAYVYGKDRKLRVDEPRPDIGFHRFEVRGRNARALEAVEPDFSGLPKERGHYAGGWLVHGNNGVERLMLLPEDEPTPLATTRARRWHSGDYLFEAFDFDGEAEELARLRLEKLEPLGDAKGIAATLRTAFGVALTQAAGQRRNVPISFREALPFASIVSDRGEPAAIEQIARIERERRVAEEQLLREAIQAQDRARIQELMARRPAAATRRGAEAAPTIDNAPQRAEAALDGAHARMLASRRQQQNLQVTFEFMGERFIAVVDALTLQVLDAGVCLAGADRLVTLDSLPGVIREAIQTSRLVITRR